MVILTFGCVEVYVGSKTRKSVAFSLAILVGALILTQFFSKEDQIIQSTGSSTAQIPTNEARGESTEKAGTAKPITAEYTNAESQTWKGDEIFETVDPAVINDSMIQKEIAGAPLNRYRVVKINTDEIRHRIRESSKGSEFKLHLFEDLMVTGVTGHSEEHYDGRLAGHASWRGNIDGNLGSPIIITTGPGGIASIRVSGAIGKYVVTWIQGTPFHIIGDYYPVKIDFANDTY